MSRDPLRLRDYLGHILEAISQIQNYCEDIDEVSFLTNRMIQDAVIRNFEIIGERCLYVVLYRSVTSLVDRRQIKAGFTLCVSTSLTIKANHLSNQSAVPNDFFGRLIS